MKVETVEQNDEEVIELAARQEMKSLMDGIDPPVINDPNPEAKSEEVPEQTESQEAKTEEPQEQPPTEKNELQEALERIQKLERALDKTNGTYGNELNRMRQKITDIESRKRELTAKITPAQFKRIREQFGDDLADALAGDLSETASEDPAQRIEQQQQVTAEADPRLDAVAHSTDRLAEQVRQMALTELSRIHPDWRKVAAWETENIDGVGSVIRWSDPSFGVWLNQQDSDTRNVVFASDDINAVSQVLTKYKQESGSTNQQAETQSPNKTAINKKLERSVLPTGRRTGAHELLTEEEVIAKAAQEEQKRIMNGY